MSLELKGTVKQILPKETGEGKNGAWSKQTFILEYMDGNYPKTVALTGMNKSVERIEKLGVGETVTASFNAESREYNGRWYTDLKSYKIMSESGATPPQPQHEVNPNTDKDDQLPF